MLAKHRSSAYKVSLKGATTTRLPHLKRWFGATRSGLADFPVIARSAWVWVNGGGAMSSPVVRSRNVLKRNSMRFAAALLAALASFVAGPNVALAAAPQHHDQVPGFYRLKVGDLEVTALFDGAGVFDPHWLNGAKATIDGVVKALHEDPHMLDGCETGFLVNTGKQLILVDAGGGTWYGGGALGGWGGGGARPAATRR